MTRRGHLEFEAQESIKQPNSGTKRATVANAHPAYILCLY